MEFKVVSPRSQYQTWHKPNSIFLVLLFLNSRARPTGQNIKDHQQPDISGLLPTFHRVKIESSRPVWYEYVPSPSSVFYIGCNRLELSWIPKCMPRWDANQVKNLWAPFSAAHWWMSHKPGCQLNGHGQVVWLHFSFSVFDWGTEKSFRQKKKEEKVYLSTASTIPPIISTLICSSFPLKSGALPLEGTMNLGKTAAFFKKKKKKKMATIREGP